MCAPVVWDAIQLCGRGGTSAVTPGGSAINLQRTPASARFQPVECGQVRAAKE